jgi:hypothetical protein
MMTTPASLLEPKAIAVKTILFVEDDLDLRLELCHPSSRWDK